MGTYGTRYTTGNSVRTYTFVAQELPSKEDKLTNCMNSKRLAY